MKTLLAWLVLLLGGAVFLVWVAALVYLMWPTGVIVLGVSAALFGLGAALAWAATTVGLIRD